MPNQCQPQGVTKHVLNPEANVDGKFIIDFEMPEDDGIATASHLHLTLDDGVERADIDVKFNPALLRTRFDQVTVNVESSTATNLHFYIINQPEHLDDYSIANKAVAVVEADKPQLINIQKLNDVVMFTEGKNCQRVELYPAPEDGSTTSTPSA